MSSINCIGSARHTFAFQQVDFNSDPRPKFSYNSCCAPFIIRDNAIKPCIGFQHGIFQ